MPGIVILTTVPSGSVTGFSPPMSTSPSPPAALLNTITPVAPETWARPILLSNRQPPSLDQRDLASGVGEVGIGRIGTGDRAGRAAATHEHNLTGHGSPWQTNDGCGERALDGRLRAGECAARELELEGAEVLVRLDQDVAAAGLGDRVGVALRTLREDGAAEERRAAGGCDVE